MFNYVFVILLAAMWWIVFLLPVPKKKKNKARLLFVVRSAGIWWVLGMSYNFLGFLMPNRSLLGVFDKILLYTIALPCRLGIGLENARVNAFALARFDLALAMILGLPWALIGSFFIYGAIAGVRKSRLVGQRRDLSSM
ncbi:MAG: hypothetical protein DDT36_01326 [Firmicutes bacterium]|nr:hypothetical protein [Bacillota bacterium]MBT9158320.1 hypothetical protein [Bacillota bacterium]